VTDAEIKAAMQRIFSLPEREALVDALVFMTENGTMVRPEAEVRRPATSRIVGHGPSHGEDG
jgi:hypothetical protein